MAGKGAIFNWAGFVLFLTIIFGLGISFLRVNNFDSIKEKNQEIQITIIGKKVDNFNQEIWYAWYNFSIWQIQSKTRLEIGYDYKFRGDQDTFETQEKFELYNLSTGVTGKLNIKSELQKNLICNLNCQVIKNIYNLKLSWEKLYLQNSCHDFYPLISTISPTINCSDVAGLSIGLVLGGTDYFSKELKGDFKKTGIMHIVAVSGFQVGLIMSFVEFLSRKVLLPRNLRFGLFIFTLGFFIFLFGPEPPVIRSSLSFLIGSGSILLLGRSVNGIRALIYSGLIMLLVNPFYLFSISFQLSFVASFALIVSFENDLFNFKHLNNFWNLFSSTVATFLYTLPILVSIGAGISLIAIATNILIIPSIPFITALNVIGLIPFIGSFFIMLSLIFQTIFILLIQNLSQLLPVVNFDKFNFLELVIYYLLITIVFLFIPKLVSKLKSPKRLDLEN